VQLGVSAMKNDARNMRRLGHGGSGSDIGKPGSGCYVQIIIGDLPLE